jgi:transcriptional regulator with XRE-family HTH domain
MTTTIAERLLFARERANLTQAQVAERLDISPSAVSSWEPGTKVQKRPDLDKFIGLSEIYRVNLLWLAFGVGDIENEIGTTGVSFRAKRGRAVPRVNMKFAVSNDLNISQQNAEIHTYYDCGERSYAIDIIDKSNVTSREHGFNPGDTVVIDPDEKPRPGDMVLAAMNPDDRTIFRRYQVRTSPEGTKYIELRPLNPDWEIDMIRSTSDGRIIGVMTEHATPRP